MVTFFFSSNENFNIEVKFKNVSDKQPHSKFMQHHHTDVRYSPCPTEAVAAEMKRNVIISLMGT